MASRLTTEQKVAVAENQSKVVRALFNTMQPDRRFSIAVDELHRAAEDKGMTDAQVISVIRSECQTRAKIRAEVRTEATKG